MNTYVAIAYRWGWLNNHQYIIYAGSDKAKAVALASAENSDSAGKYGCAVYEYADQSDGEQKSELLSYHPSSYGEQEPEHNYRIDMFQKLGHRFHDFADGTVYLPAGDGTLQPNAVFPPQWVIDERDRAQKMCDAMETAQRYRTSRYAAEHSKEGT